DEGAIRRAWLSEGQGGRALAPNVSGPTTIGAAAWDRGRPGRLFRRRRSYRASQRAAVTAAIPGLRPSMRLVPIARRTRVDLQRHAQLQRGMRRFDHHLADQLDRRLDLVERG